jgi:hypothetical protein
MEQCEEAGIATLQIYHTARPAAAWRLPPAGGGFEAPPGLTAAATKEP